MRVTTASRLMTYSMLGGLLFSVMDTTIVSTALVTIATDFADFQDMYWVVLAYMLSYLGNSPLNFPKMTNKQTLMVMSFLGCAIGFAKLSDHFGRLQIFLFSWLIFSGFSLGCGISSTMTQLSVTFTSLLKSITTFL